MQPKPRPIEALANADTASCEPLSTADFDAFMEPFTPFSSRIGVAVSGGPDSMALAWCLKSWSSRHRHEVTALIVDHGLRIGSAAEAERVKNELSSLDLTSEILLWQHSPVTTRLHVTARKARYRLLIEACQRLGIRDLFLAHQLEDQAETILMRLAKGSGIDGLAGMSGQNIIDGTRIVRPLLNVSKERLMTTCRTAKLFYVTDPSNSSDKFARGRLRRVLPILKEEGLSIDRLVDLGSRAREAKEALDHYTIALLTVASRLDGAGVLRFDIEHLRSTPSAVAQRALSLCLQSVHSEDYPPERSALLRLFKALIDDKDMPPRTLHGCLVSKSARYATITREFSAIKDSQNICVGETIVWDQRWRVSLAHDDKPCEGEQEKIGGANLSLAQTDNSQVKNVGLYSSHLKGYTIAALGNPTHNQLDRLAPDLRHIVPQGRARAALPALWLNGELALIPSLPHTPTISGAGAIVLTEWPPSLHFIDAKH